MKEMKDPFLHGDFDSMDMFTRVTVENALYMHQEFWTSGWIARHCG